MFRASAPSGQTRPYLSIAITMRQVSDTCYTVNSAPNFPRGAQVCPYSVPRCSYGTPFSSQFTLSAGVAELADATDSKTEMQVCARSHIPRKVVRGEPIRTFFRLIEHGSIISLSRTYARFGQRTVPSLPKISLAKRSQRVSYAFHKP
jgi:hypothetical protein